MREIEKIAEALFDKIRSRFDDVSIGDEKAKSTLDPSKARFFNFDFELDGHNYGNITISLADQDALKIYYNKDIAEELDDVQKKNWYGFLRTIRFFAQRNMLTFDTRDISKKSLKTRDIAGITKDADVFDKAELGITESKLHGTSRSSYQSIGPARIIVRHSGRVNEESPGARSRHINAIYIENNEGERFKLPFTNLNGARAMARHVANGGQTIDEFGQHIGTMIKEMSDLKMFVRNMRGRTFEDAETTGMVEAAIDHYGALHRDVHGLRSQRGYTQYKESWTPELHEDEYDLNALKERFVKRVFDDRLMDALPVVQRAYDQRKNAVAEEFEQWANSMIEDDSDIDGEQDNLGDLFDGSDLDYELVDGVYYFTSQDELNRAKDIIAYNDPDLDFPNMSVRNVQYGTYGSNTMDEPKVESVQENTELSFIKTLAGLTK
jgi:hypothetical protein